MRIESSSIFSFYFPYEGHEITIPVRAESRAEACQKLLNFFKQWGMEISMEVPQVVPTPSPLPNMDVRAPDPYLMELSIEDLVKAIMPLKKPKGAQTVQTLVKDWTGFVYAPENYPAIISELEKLKNGNN